MKKRLSTIILAIFLLLCLSSCSSNQIPAQIAATTLPVYEMTTELCRGTPLTVTQLISESVSCLHDYSLRVDQVRTAEQAEVIVVSGAGLEEFMTDLLNNSHCIDASENIPLLCGTHEESHEHEHEHEHHHEEDPHIWLSPRNASAMVQNICSGLTKIYPENSNVFQSNLNDLLARLNALQEYGEKELKQLNSRNLITFHDGFAYFADAFDLNILEAIEEESGSEASAKELIHLIKLVRSNHLPAIFTEKKGSSSAAAIISSETNAKSYVLDMAMSGGSYFDIMYRNIDTIKEAMG